GEAAHLQRTQEALLAAFEVLDEQAGAVAVDGPRQPPGRELVDQLGEDAASGRSVHLPSITAYKCQNQWREMQCPLVYRAFAERCEPFFTWEHEACATMGSTRSDVSIR